MPLNTPTRNEAGMGQSAAVCFIPWPEHLCGHKSRSFASLRMTIVSESLRYALAVF